MSIKWTNGLHPIRVSQVIFEGLQIKKKSWLANRARFTEQKIPLGQIKILTPLGAWAVKRAKHRFFSKSNFQITFSQNIWYILFWYVKFCAFIFHFFPSAPLSFTIFEKSFWKIKGFVVYTGLFNIPYRQKNSSNKNNNNDNTASYYLLVFHYYLGI